MEFKRLSLNAKEGVFVVTKRRHYLISRKSCNEICGASPTEVYVHIVAVNPY